MIVVEPHAGGCILPVRVQPGARRGGVRGERQGMLHVAVTQPAEKGMANQAAIESLCEALGLKRSQIELASGRIAPRKKFLVRGISAAELSARVQAALAAGS